MQSESHLPAAACARHGARRPTRVSHCRMMIWLAGTRDAGRVAGGREVPRRVAQAGPLVPFRFSSSSSRLALCCSSRGAAWLPVGESARAPCTGRAWSPRTQGRAMSPLCPPKFRSSALLGTPRVLASGVLVRMSATGLHMAGPKSGSGVVWRPSRKCALKAGILMRIGASDAHFLREIDLVPRRSGRAWPGWLGTAEIGFATNFRIGSTNSH